MFVYQLVEEDKWARCEKCNAAYKLCDGRFSARQSCRYHTWETGPFPKCILCYRLKSQSSGQNCYHISKESCCIIL